MVDIEKQWSEKNKLDIEEAIPKNKYIWQCEYGHEWLASLGNRKYQKTGCPYCKSKKPSPDNNLKSKFPDISSEWDYEKNELMPEDYLPSSNRRVNWICKKGHTWESIIGNRTRQNNNCPVCFKNESWCENYIFGVLSNLTSVTKLKNPEIDIYLSELNIGIEYDGYYHKFRYEQDIKKNLWASRNLNLLIRIRESYLPELPTQDKVLIIKQEKSDKISCKKSIISIINILNLSSNNLNFDISVESKIRNKEMSDDLIKSWSTNNKIEIEYAMKTHKYLWICDICKSEYETDLRSRMKKNCCHFCSSQKVNKSNSLYDTHPKIMKYISKNNKIDPKSVTTGTGKRLLFLKNNKEVLSTPRNFLRYLKEFSSFQE